MAEPMEKWKAPCNQGLAVIMLPVAGTVPQTETQRRGPGIELEEMNVESELISKNRKTRK